MQRLNLLHQAISQQQQSLIYDYVIVGAGISGMQAAEVLTTKTNLISILQAQQQQGGRVQTLTVDDILQSRECRWLMDNMDHYKKITIENGATWVQARHHMIIKMCQKYNIPLQQQYSKGSNIYLTNQSNYTNVDIMKSDKFGKQLIKFINNIDQLAKLYDLKVLSYQSKQLNDQYKTMLAKYDTKTVQQYLNEQINNKQIRQFVENFLQHTECVSVSQNSMHEVLTKHARSNDIGILKQFLGSWSHEPSYIIEGGTNILLQKLISNIQKNIKCSLDNIIQYKCQVITIDNSRKNYCTVIAIDGNNNNNKIIKKKCKKVICAIPTAVSRNLMFTNISSEKRYILDNQLRTNTTKIFVIFRKPFWRTYNRTGDGLFSYSYKVNMCHDISPKDKTCGILVFFNSGKKYHQWQKQFVSEDLKTKKQYILQIVKKMFKVTNEDKQKYFTDVLYYESNFMMNQYIRSGFQSNTRPGTFKKILNMGGGLYSFYQDQYNIIFIGSQYCQKYASYIQGAVRIARQKMYKEIKMIDPFQLQQ